MSLYNELSTYQSCQPGSGEHRPYRGSYYPSLAQSTLYRDASKGTLLLIIREAEVRTLLAHLLQTNGYLVFAVADAAAAIALLTTQAVTFIALHDSGTALAETMQTYKTIQLCTTIPVVMLPVITMAAFDQAAPITVDQPQTVLHRYLQTIALLSRIFASS